MVMAPEQNFSISYVGVAYGTDSATLPAHQVGDMIVGLICVNDGSSLPTTVSGWSDLVVDDLGTNRTKVVYKQAESDGEVSGTWTGADKVAFVVYRGVRAFGDFHTAGSANGTNTTPSFYTRTLVGDGGVEDLGGATSYDGQSWVVSLVHIIGAAFTGYDTAPTGMTNRSSNQGTDTIAIHDTNGPYTSSTWPTTTTSLSASANWQTWTFELKSY